MMKTIVILPTYNEKENIRKIVPLILQTIKGINILIVDDNSPDNTGEIADKLSKKYPGRVFVLHRQEKNGLGKAYIAGFKWAFKKNYDVIIQMDADFSHDPKYIHAMLREINQNDLVIGSRYIKGGGTKDWGIIRQIISRGGNLYSKIILGLPINDLTGGFKCWRAKLLKKMDLSQVTSSGYCFQIEMNYKAHKSGARIKEIPIIFVDRVLGNSKMSKSIVLEAMWKVWRLKFKQ